MKLSEALKIAESANRKKGVLVEQVRMQNLADDSYAVIIKRPEGDIWQIEDPKDWPDALKDPEPEVVPTPEGEVVT